jgi:hypothetical protein
MKPSFHSLIPFLPLFCNYQFSSIPLLPNSYPGTLASRNSTRLLLLKWIVLYNNFARTTQKTQPLYCWKGVFTAPLHNIGSYAIVACVFVAARMCLPCRCLAMNVYSDRYSGFRAPCHITLINLRLCRVGHVASMGSCYCFYCLCTKCDIVIKNFLYHSKVSNLMKFQSS